MSESIWTRRRMLDKERRDYMQLVMAEFDARRAEQLKQLYAECEETTGHFWQHSHNGPMGDPWFVCSHCGLMKVNAE